MRLYRSVSVWRHVVVAAPNQSDRANAAAWPQRQGLPSRSQVWSLSGASMPCRRMRWPRISIVSPSITDARPVKSAAVAGSASKHKAIDRTRRINRHHPVGHHQKLPHDPRIGCRRPDRQSDRSAKPVARHQRHRPLKMFHRLTRLSRDASQRLNDLRLPAGRNLAVTRERRQHPLMAKIL